MSLFGAPDPREADRAREALVRRARLAVWRNRIGFALVAMLVVGLVTGGIVGIRAWKNALSDECDTWPQIDLSMDQILDLRRRERDYQASPDPEAMVTVGAAEITALLRDQLTFEVDFQSIDGALVTLVAAFPEKDGCYNVHFQGRVKVDERVATIEPISLVIGETDLTGWLSGRGYRLDPATIDGWIDPKVVRGLKNTERLRIADGMVTVRLYDPYQSVVSMTRLTFLPLLIGLLCGCAATVRVESRPNGAIVTLKDGSTLSAPGDVHVGFWPFARKKVTVSSTGFRSETVTLRRGVRRVEVVLVPEHGPSGTWTPETEGLGQ